MSRHRRTVAVLGLALGLGACSEPSLTNYVQGTWMRAISVPASTGFGGESTLFCSENDHTLELREDGSYTDVQALTPTDHPDCPDEPALTWTRSGTWLLLEWTDDGEVLLVQTQEREEGVYDGPRDDIVNEDVSEISSAVSTATQGDTDYLEISAYGVFTREGG